MMRHSSAALLALGLSFVLLAAQPAAAADATFQVIVHSETKGRQIPRGVLSSIFLMEVTRWGDGSGVFPVDQSMRSPVRARFTENILGRPTDGLQSFWHKRMMAGVFPPPVKSSDEAVVAFVAAKPGAIGYVAAGIPLPSGVRTVTIVD